jgi:Flp pilus assembly protein TadG
MNTRWVWDPLRFLRDDRGGVAAYAAMAALTAIGAGAVAVDVGRAAILRTQMQNTADARAMAAAAQLDGRDGARARATTVAKNVMASQTAIAADSATIKAKDPVFYSEYTPTKILATSDQDAAIVEVTLEAKRVDYLFGPILRFISTGSGKESQTIVTYAAAQPEPFICHAPPLMICDYGDQGGGAHDNTLDLRNPVHIGQQVRLKQQGTGGTWAPGNFGLLSLPDGSSGAGDLEAALAALSPEDCYSLDVTTATGSKTQKIVDAVNSRFDLTGNPWPYPAADVVNYPRDPELISSSTEKLGSGNWDITGYWAAKHGGNPVPADLANASRYQVYLYEMGLTYARNGKQTMYPISDTLPAGYTVIDPPPAAVPVAANPANKDDPNYDGVPRASNPTYYKDPTKDYARRLVQVVQLQCISNGVKGKHDYPTQANYLEVFLTESMQNPPNADMYGEVVRALTPTNTPEFHANVRLIR